LIRSMTGFGRVDFALGGRAFQLELRSVNHRHLDVAVRLPRPFAAHEHELRSRLQARFARGKLELSLLAAAGAAPAARPRVDREAASLYVEAARELSREHGLGGELDAGRLLQLPGVVRLEEPELPDEAVAAALLDAADRAAGEVTVMREAEGRALERDLVARLDAIAGLVERLASRAEAVAESVRERLRKRADQLVREVGSVDDARLAQEIVHAADRGDVTEEVVRLRSHVEQFRSALAGGSRPTGGEGEGPVGRRLDFLLQEMLREANTIGSKGGDAPISHAVVELKTELERVREQAQTVE
jgi:uncharacterized protein (TIGR00255 family)